MACNNYEVIDLGVMVPAEKILQAALNEKVDIIGLSGLITPSLEEMVHVAKEMQRLGFTLPLLIGGATTSEIHAAVKIDPQYSASVIHVRDASKSIGVLSNLFSRENKIPYSQKVKKQYDTMRKEYEAGKTNTIYITLQEARENRFITGWEKTKIIKPQFLGNKYFLEYPLEEISPYIDWTFLFHAWKLNGKYPAIFDDPVKGIEARKLFEDATTQLNEIIAKKMLKANGAVGLYPCNSVGDDIEIYSDETRSTILTKFHFLRNQQKKENNVPNLCLADFVAPKESGMIDYMGCFAVTAGAGLEKWVDYYQGNLDDYGIIMMKILADRLAEAFAEQMHKKIRKEFWGYESDEQLELKSLLKEEYIGIRPAPGYPACPEHSEKKILFDLLDVEKHTGIFLTENFAMYPAASVSGFYFAHPDSKYFALGKISKEQVAEYAERKNISFELAEKYLNTNLNY
jgi:5-methyltetrahydrofolate--homocysteine methyltransferase